MASKLYQAAIVSRIEQDDLPLCVTVLESALACAQWGQDAALPPPLLEEIAKMYGEAETKNVCADFTELGLLTDAMFLAPEYARFAADLIAQLVVEMELRIGGRTETAGMFQAGLLGYLGDHVEGLEVEQSAGLGRSLLWEGKRFTIQLAFSPVWLPVAAESAARADACVAFIGPFAAQHWESLYPYYAYPDFRDHVACFDPWSCRKMNISKGGVFSYFDWFFRDKYGQRFLIEDTFKKALHDMRLLRYDDEG